MSAPPLARRSGPPIASAKPRGHSGARYVATVWSLRVLVLLVIVFAWQLSASQHWVSPIFSSEPSQIAVSLGDGLRQGSFWAPIGTTLYETAIGFAIGSGLGMLVGLTFYEVPLAEVVGRPFMTGFNSVPRIALAPLFVLWFGLGSLSRVVLSVTLVFFIAAATTYAGLQGCDRDYLLLARTLGAKRWERFSKFVLPSAIPSVFAGLQLGLTYSFLAVVAGEMLGGSGGLGAVLQLSLATYDTARFFAALLLLAIISIAAASAMRALERRLLRWRVIELRGTGSDL